MSELCREITAAGANKSSSDATTINSSSTTIITNNENSTEEVRINDLERRVAGRFTVIWSVFRAHSAAEDEFIWPALKAKQVALPDSSCGCDCASSAAADNDALPVQQQQPVAAAGGEPAAAAAAGGQDQQQRERAQSITVHRIEQEEYEEDHIDEERMFNSINDLLSKLREELSNRRKDAPTANSSSTDSSKLHNVAQMLLEGTRNLMHHLMTHLDKEETHCMPLVAQYLTKAEINDLVGKIMGKRSSELMSQILTMAVQNLNEKDRDDMVRYMKQAMVGTFFERWLKMGGWMKTTGGGEDETEEDGDKKPPAVPSTASTDESSDAKVSAASMNEQPTESTEQPQSMSSFANQPYVATATAASSTTNHSDEEETEKYTSAAELEKLIRAIGTNSHLDAKQKTLTIQGLRDSVWKSNCRLSKRKREEGNIATLLEQQPAAQMSRVASASLPATDVVPLSAVAATGSSTAAATAGGHNTAHQQSHHMSFSVASGVATRFKRETPPSSYFKKMEDGEVKLVWSR